MFDIDKPAVAEEEKTLLLRCLNEPSLTQGKYVADFERGFAKYCGIKHGCAVMNGTSALHLALAAVGIKPDDEVLVPSLTFIASISPVSYCGAKPVFVDCDPRTWCIDPDDLRAKITPKSKAVIPVHLYGNSCHMDEICAIASEYNLVIVEDSAEAHGTLYNNKQVGSFSDITFFSFYKNKHITTGEGGMCLTDSDFLNERMRLLRCHGKEKVEDLSDEDFAQRQFISSELGFNYRMMDLQAAIGLAQLARIDDFISQRKAYADLYVELLQGLDVTLPYAESNVKHTFWGFPILLKNPQIKTDTVLQFRKHGIRLRPFFNPCHLQPFYKSFQGKCPVSEDVSLRGVVLPNMHTLAQQDIRQVAELLRKLLA